MSNLIPGNQKHLTLKDRIYIEESLDQGRSFKEIARFLCKDPTTISKEVKAHRKHEPHFTERLFYNAKNFCTHRFHCKKTNACGKIELCGVKCASCPTCKSGEGYLEQNITLPDGTIKKMAIWGGYELDGYDRTLNVFMKQSDIGTFIDLLSSTIATGKLNTDGIEDPCQHEEGYQITVDFVDKPVTAILRKGQGKLSLESFVRDERKTCRNAVESITGEVDLEEDGTLHLDAEKVENNRFLVFALAFLGVRKHLLFEGIVQKLYEMYDESAGVLIDVSKDGKITSKIVKGLERPNLPCNVFLLGEQSCRPYFDELLGLNPKRVRKPRNPKLVEKPEAAKDEKSQTQEDHKTGLEKEQVAEESGIEAIDNTIFQVLENTLIRYEGNDTDVVIPKGITAIGDGKTMTFSQTQVASVSIPNSVTKIGGYAFFQCDTLKKINIPDSVTSIGDHAFRQCSQLETIIIPDGVEAIERECFWGCQGLKEVRLPENLRIIEEKAFSGCTSLPALDIPDGTEVIEDGAFWGG